MFAVTVLEAGEIPYLTSLILCTGISRLQVSLNADSVVNSMQKIVSGIGLNFINDEFENQQIRVKSILKGGSAENNGKIRVGDILLGVGSNHVLRGYTFRN